MACSSPNSIELDARYKGITFLGPSQFARELIDRRLAAGVDGYVTQIFDVPCNDCLDCRIARRYERATRIMLEASCFEKNCFVTLTYSDQHLGYNDLAENHFTQFQKDIRRVYGQAEYCPINRKNWKKKTRSYTHKNFKFIQTGEYGEGLGRKHYHGIIFNHTFSDMYFTGFYSDKGNPIYSSFELEKLWGRGNVQVEALTFDLALYVGKYITDGWDDDENVLNLDTGLIRKKQYSRSSHGIGLTWLKKYWKGLLGKGLVSLFDRNCPIPRYFKKKLAELFPIEYARYKTKKYLEINKKMLFIKNNKGDGMLASSIRAGEITKIIHKRNSNGSHPKGYA
nr:MAG: replication initiator protein [Microvirus sp.]